MSILLYQVEKDGVLTKHEGIKLPRAFQKHLTTIWDGSDEPVRWHLSQDDLIKLLLDEESSSENHRIVIDLKPNRKDGVNLYTVQGIWGVSYFAKYWTPVMMRLQFICEESCNDPETFKARISLPSSVKLAHEFLYLRHGERPDEVGWQWGRIGYVNGALLSDDALEYFVSELGFTKPASHSVAAGGPT